MKAKKENKVYQVDEVSKQRYLDQGYDIYDDNGGLIETSPLTTITIAEHEQKLVEATKEQRDLIAAKDEQIQNLMTTNEDLAKRVEGIVAVDVLELLTGYAEAKKIDIGSSTSAKGVLDKITEAEKV